jgi:hypothetical protein
MADPHVITALHGKHARLKGFIRHHENTLAQLRADLDHVEATIRLFKEDWQEGEKIAPYKPSRWLRRGQGAQTALSVLREASDPITARQIALAVFERLEQPVPSRDILDRQVSTFNGILSRRIGKGVARHDGKPWRWSIER